MIGNLLKIHLIYTITKDHKSRENSQPDFLPTVENILNHLHFLKYFLFY